MLEWHPGIHMTCICARGSQWGEPLALQTDASPGLWGLSKQGTKGGDDRGWDRVPTPVQVLPPDCGSGSEAGVGIHSARPPKDLVTGTLWPWTTCYCPSIFFGFGFPVGTVIGLGDTDKCPVHCLHRDSVMPQCGLPDGHGTSSVFYFNYFRQCRKRSLLECNSHLHPEYRWKFIYSSKCVYFHPK